MCFQMLGWISRMIKLDKIRFVYFAAIGRNFLLGQALPIKNRLNGGLNLLEFSLNGPKMITRMMPVMMKREDDVY